MKTLLASFLAGAALCIIARAEPTAPSPTSSLSQVRGDKGTPREWVFVQLGGGWCAREQGWKLTESGALFDMSDAPFAEKAVPVEAQSEAAAAARQRLQAVLAKLDPSDGAAATPGKGRKKMRAKERSGAAADETQKPAPAATPPAAN